MNFLRKQFTPHGTVCLFILCCFTLFLSGCSDSHHHSSSTPITVLSAESVPYVYESNGEIVGMDADTAKHALDIAGIAAEFRIDNSWDDAYQATLDGSNRALLNVIYTKEDRDRFKWAGPTSKNSYHVFVKDSSGDLEAIGVEKTKDIGLIAVVTGWRETTKLEELGFENLEEYPSYEAAIAAFKNDEIKGIASDSLKFVSTVGVGYYMSEQIHVATTYDDMYMFIAFSKDVDDQVVNKCQDAINSMVIDKTNLDILRKYDPLATDRSVPGIIQLMTEVSPPINYISSVDGANVTYAGSSIDIVNEIQSRNGHKDAINISGWVVGFAAAQYMPNYALFTTARTPERENLFQWVGPIASFKSNLYTKAGSDISFTTLEQAKAYKIATPYGWYTHDFLNDNGFTNILTTSYTAEGAFKQLESGEADVVLLEDQDIELYCDMYGIPRENIINQLKAVDYEGYIAFSPSTAKSIIDQWQNNLDAMKNDGKFDEIWNKWYSGI